jgi:SAM-dependent methyltransferase
MDSLKSWLERIPPGVERAISPNDEMYRVDSERYFDWGKAALSSLRLALLAAGRDAPGRVFDLPCGHGRVLRMLSAAFPGAELTACDIDPEAVDFCVRTFGARAVYASPDPRSIPLTHEFDLIWCGSLLTHMDKPNWIKFLQVFETSLAPGGILVFTTHGRRVAERARSGQLQLGLHSRVSDALSEFDRTGFGYAAHRPADPYGVSFSSPAWVCSLLAQVTKLRLLSLSEQGWYYHHDSVACLRGYNSVD